MLLEVLGCFLGLGLIWAVFGLRRAKERSKFPPGPQGWPVIGNVPSWPSKEKWLTFAKWGQIYGALLIVFLVRGEFDVDVRMQVNSPISLSPARR
jgi:hypothetical protein